MTYVLTFTIDGPPKRALLTANERAHWRRRAERSKYWRQRAYLEATSAIRRGDLEPLTWAHFTVDVAWPDKRRRDVANVHPTVKAIVDGLVDAGVLPDDDDRHLMGPDLRRAFGPASITLHIDPDAEAVAS